MSKSNEATRDFIRDNYARVAQSGAALSCCVPNNALSCCAPSTAGCCSPGSVNPCCGPVTDAVTASMKLGYSASDLEIIPGESNMGLGCGNPVALAELREGETVLDLGSGGGIDCFLAAQRVGLSGKVIGVDMTPEMIKLARKNASEGNHTNVEFRLGEIEHLPVEDDSIDAIISNCVINLSPDKAQVFCDAFRVLKPGGRISISDIVAVAEIPQEMRDNMALIAGCVGNAEHIDVIEQLMLEAGFVDVELVLQDNLREIIASWFPESNAAEYVTSCIIKGRKPYQASEVTPS